MTAPRSEVTGFRLRELVRDVPVAVWAVTAAHLLVLVCSTVLAPTYRAPDEYKHVDAILALYHGQGWAEPGDRSVSEQVYESVRYLDFVWHSPRQHAAGEAPFRADRPSFAELGGTQPWDGPLQVEAPGHSPEALELERGRRLHNAATQHPPLYYLLLSVVLRIVPGVDGWAFDQVVGFLRLCNVLLAAPVPLFVFAGARRLLAGAPGRWRRAVPVAAAAALLTIPQWTHLAATINNDNLLNPAAALLTVILIGVADGDRSLRSALWLGALLAVALLTKGLALVLPLWVAAAYALGWWRTRGPLPWRPLATAAAVSLAGAWWWLVNLVVHGSLQPAGEAVPAVEGGSGATFGAFLRDWYAQFVFERWWGSFGWIDTPLPDGVVAAATVTFAAGVAAALLLRWRGDRDTRADAALLLVPAGLLLVLNVRATWSYFAVTGIPAGIQGRYLYVGLAGVLICVALGYGRVLGAARRWLPLALLAAAAAMQAVGLLVLLGRYWGTPDGGLRDALAGVAAWSPWSGRWVALVFAATAVVASGTVVVVVREALRPPVPEPAPAAVPRASAPDPDPDPDRGR